MAPSTVAIQIEESLILFGPPQPGDRGPGLIVLAAVSMLVTTLLVGCRMYRAYQVNKFKAEDGLILLSGLLVYAVDVGFCVATRYGAGKHISNVLFSNISLATTIPIDIGAVVVAAIACAKTSVGITLFHLKLSKTYSFVIVLTIVLTIAGNLQNMVVASNICHPNFNGGAPPANCFALSINSVSSFVQAGINIGTDVVFVVAPIMALRGVAISRGDRLAISFLLASMFLATIVSIFKVVSLYNLDVAVTHTNRFGIPDITWAELPLEMFGIAEPSLCVMAACLPCVRLLLGERYKIFGRTVVETTQASATRKTDISVAHSVTHRVSATRASSWLDAALVDEDGNSDKSDLEKHSLSRMHTTIVGGPGSSP